MKQKYLYRKHSHVYRCGNDNICLEQCVSKLDRTENFETVSALERVLKGNFKKIHNFGLIFCI